MADQRRNLIGPTAMRISSLLTLCILSVSTVHGKFGADINVCDLGKYADRASKDTGPKKPTLPQQWTVRIEGNIIDHNYTQDIHEYYDGVDNRGAVVEYIGGVQTQMIFLYATNELITLQFDNSGNPPRCHVDDLAKSMAKNVFGLKEGAGGAEHIFSANQALRFGGKIPEVYVGRDTARDGILVDAWESCNYWDTLDGTFHLIWYFSANNTWTTAINQIVPVQLAVDGIVHVNTSYSYPVNRKYVFTDFRPVLFDGPIGAFDTPVGTYCVNRVSTEKLNNVTNMFTFASEIFEPSSSVVNWIKEYYDYNLGLVKYDYTPDPGSYSQYGHNQLTRVHDFNTGVAYIMDRKSGNCSVSQISALGFDAKSLDGGKVRMRTKKEFFYFDNTHYEYAGQRLARGITCNVWTAIRSDYPPGNPIPQTVWEWYFASHQWLENIGMKVEFELPVMLQVTSINPPMDIIYNIYDYYEGDPKIWQTDVSSCFDYTHQKHFSLKFPGDYRDDIANDVDDFKFAVVQTIVAMGGISPLRISGLSVDYTLADILVSFTLLDKAPIQGDTSGQSGFIDRTLSDVVNGITQAVSTNQFTLFLDPTNFPSVKTGQLTAKPYSASSSDVKVDTIYTVPGTTGYSAGAMGGLGVAMLIVGFAIGFAILFGIYKMKGGSFTGSFSPKTFTDSKEME